MRKSWLLRGTVLTCSFILLTLIYLSSAFAYPHWGEIRQLKQPDGTWVDVRVWGDEFYQVVESPDGYTLIRDPSTHIICYATLSSDGSQLMSTGAEIGTVDPMSLGLQKHIRINQEAMTKIASQIRSRQAAEEKKFEASLADRGIDIAAYDPACTGNVEGICFIVDFSDMVATVPRDDIDDFCNMVGFTGSGNNGSVRDYFTDVSNGLLTYTNFVPSAYYRASHTFAYYDDSSQVWLARAVELIFEMLDHYNPDIDYSDFDSNGDGYIDAINVYYAGSPQWGWTKGMWPGSGWITDQWSGDGVKTLRFQVTDIGGGLNISTFCHENGHMLAFWPDLYDYDKPPNDSYGVGKFCLMCNAASGTNPVEPCAYLKHTAGWATVTDLATAQMGLTIPTSSTNTFYKINHPTLPNEFYMISNRQQTARDAEIPDNGLAIWHIDENGNNSDEDMTPALHYLVTLVQADGNWDMENYVNTGDATDLYSAPGHTACTPCTDPNTNWWAGSASGIMITNISASAATMSFDFSPEDLPPVAVTKNYSAHADGTCCLTFNVSDIDNGSYDPNGVGDVASLCITAVDAVNVGCQESYELCGVGTYTVTLTITDLCGNTDSQNATVEVQNQAPIAQCVSYYVDDADENCCITVHKEDLDDGSYDPDGAADIASFGITAIDGGDLGGAQDSVTLCGSAIYSLTLTITDHCGETSSCDVDVEVRDVTPPEITVTLDRDILWPPNHKMVDINATVVVTDNCDPDPAWVLADTAMSEADDGLGDGHTRRDMQDLDFGTPDTYFQVRAERSALNEERVYTFIYTATDSSGNSASDTAEVRVPHDHSGWAFASTGFTADGTSLEPELKRLVLIVPSREEEYGVDENGATIIVSEALDATAIDRTSFLLGNLKQVLKPVKISEADVNGDELIDIVLYYPGLAIRSFLGEILVDEKEARTFLKEYGPVGLHFIGLDGTDYLVPDIFLLGEPVPLHADADVPILPQPDADKPDQPDHAAPNVTALFSAYPNPFNPSTTIPFQLKSTERVSLRIYDAQGSLVRTLKDETMPAGKHEVLWNGHDANDRQVATGVYFVQLRAGEFQATKKIVMIK